jgi:hypothetical protein
VNGHSKFCTATTTHFSKDCDCATVARVLEGIRKEIEEHPGIDIRDAFSEYQHGMYVGLRMARDLVSQ